MQYQPLLVRPKFPFCASYTTRFSTQARSVPAIAVIWEFIWATSLLVDLTS